eukprot:5734201-Pleurochrysis_carterae.AAC.1
METRIEPATASLAASDRICRSLVDAPPAIAQVEVGLRLSTPCATASSNAHVFSAPTPTISTTLIPD